MRTDIRARVAEPVRFQAIVGERCISLTVDHLQALTGVLQGNPTGLSEELRYLFSESVLEIGQPRTPTVNELKALLPWEDGTILYLDPCVDVSVGVVAEGTVCPLNSSELYTYFIPPTLAIAIADLAQRLRIAGRAMLRNALTRNVEIRPRDYIHTFETIYRDRCSRSPLSDYGDIIADAERTFRLELKRPLQSSVCPYAEAVIRIERSDQRKTGISLPLSTLAVPAVSRLIRALRDGTRRAEIVELIGSSDEAPSLYNVAAAVTRCRGFGAVRPAQPDWDELLPPQATLSAFHLGHAGLLLRGSSTFVLVDPWFVAGHPGYREQPLGSNQLPPVDAVFLTHEHWDHINVPALLRYPPNVPIVVPRQHSDSPLYPRFREFLKLFGFERVIELGHWEQHSLRNGLVVTAVPFIGEGTAEDGAVRNCYLLERGGNRILVHVDSSIDSTGRSDLTDGAIERLVNERGPIDVLYATRRQELHFGFEIQHDLSPMFLGADPRRFVGVTENCFCPASYIVNLAREARCSMVVLYSEGGAEWYPSDTNFLRTGDDESFLGHDYLWDSLNDIVDAAPAPVYLSQALDAVLVDDHRIKYVSGRNRF